MSWVCPDAVTLLPAEATGGDEWLKLRREGIGSSELAAVMGEGAKDASAWTVWLDKTGRLTDTTRTGPMEWGLRSEAAAAGWFADQTGLKLRRKGLMRSEAYPLMQATVDRLTSDGGVLEVKVSETGAAYQLGKQLRRHELPRYWYWQLVAQMLVAGRDPGWLAAVVGGDLFVERLDYLDVLDDIQRAPVAVHRFWYDHVAVGVAPSRPADLALVEGGLVLDADEDLAQLLDMWAAAKRRYVDNEVYTEHLRGLVIAAMGPAAMVKVGGRLFARKRVVEADRVDVTRLRREDPDTAERFRTTGAHVRLELIT